MPPTSIVTSIFEIMVLFKVIPAGLKSFDIRGGYACEQKCARGV